jgi:hypothetical protein
LGKGKRKRKNVWKKIKKYFLCGKVLFMRDMCAKIKHGRISMTKPLGFISNSCSSQIHYWICVKIKTILV